MAEIDIDSSVSSPDEDPVLDALEQYSQFVDELFDVSRANRIFYEENTDKLAIRSVRRVIRAWDNAYSPNRPPNSLIVRLSRNLPAILAEVTSQPKKILQRRRSLEPLHRLRELDPACVRWLTQQPGLTIAEKAGQRRSILAVNRFETTNTLENRVTCELMRRCITLSSAYLRQNEEKFPEHDWVVMTRKLLNLCRKLLSISEFQEVSSLASVPKPNYVLLHDERYKEIWRSYLDVIKQQYRRQQLRKYRELAFAEMLTIAWMSSVSRLMTNRNSQKEAHRFDLSVRDSAANGHFFEWKRLPPIWQVNSRTFFYIGPLQSFPKLPLFARVESQNSEGFGFVSWNSNTVLARKISVDFSNKTTDRSHVAVALSDIQSTKTHKSITKRLLVPLNLISSPAFLDQFIDDWCAS